MLGIAAHRQLKIIQQNLHSFGQLITLSVGPGNKKAAAPATPANKGIAIFTTLPPVRRATANTTQLIKQRRHQRTE